MPRKQLIRSNSFAYHAYARSNNKEWFYISMERCWEIFNWALAKAAEKYEANIHSLVLMSNHLHLILSTPLQNIDDIMRYFLSMSTQVIQSDTGRINHVFGGRYKWTLLDSPSALAYVYKYVYRNPARAGICQSAQEYPFSTLTLGPRNVPIVEGFDSYWKLIPKDPVEKLKWLNIPTPKEQEELIGRALRRYEFKFSTSSNLQKNLRLLKRSYGIETEG